MDPNEIGKPRRHYGMDWLRIAAFALLIPFHIGDFFSPGHWVVKSAHVLAWVDWPMAALRPWRLSVLFLVSGYASAVLLGRLGRPGPFLRSRTARLLLPLAFGILVLLAPQEWVRASEAGYAGSFWRFLLVDRFAGPLAWPRAEHLWFLVYLWGYTIALVVALRTLPARWKARLAALPAWHAHLSFVPPFLFGFALAGSPALGQAAARSWRPALAIGAIGTAGLVWADLLYPGDTIPPHLPAMAILAVSVATGWAVTILLLGAAMRWLDRDHRFRRTAAEAVFPIYLVHQTIIVLAGWELRPLGLGTGAEFVLLLGATLVGGVAFYLVARQAGPLRLLFGLSAGPARGHKQPWPRPSASSIAIRPSP
jgi:hypothetical protein